MLSNTSCSDLKLVDKVSVISGGYQQKFQFSTSTSGNNNNNNNNAISKNKNMSLAPATLQSSTKPFTFYTSGGAAGGGCTPASECTTIIIQRNSSKEIAKNPPIGGATTDQSNERIHYEPCSYYNSKQENELTKKIFNNFRNDSALNGVSDGGGGGSVGVGDVVTTEKTTGDTSNSCSSSNSNSSSKSSKSDRQKSPMCRTEDQENAFRQIEDVHNYSKLNRFGYCNGRSSGTANLAMYSSNSSNQDEDEDDEEEEDEGEEEEEIEDDEDYDLDYEQHLQVRKLSSVGRQPENVVKTVVAANSAGQKQQQQQKKPEIGQVTAEVEDKIEPKVEDEGSKIPPDHHARRPMNAFLIFCKRHRGIVKNKYKNFENRSITKILGEWWASLDANDKKCYVNLANQNKDAFFSAHPNFKWYKLPAPALRTLNTRPGNIERPLPGSSEYQCDFNDSPTQGPLLDHTVTSRCEPKKVSYFKLADETQMGELNSLMRPTATPSTSDALQEALGETSDYFKTGCKRKSSSSLEDPPNTKRLQSDNSFSSSEDDLTPKKSDRSCKGKKYQELMNSGQIAAVTPKKQVITKPSRTTISRSSSSSINQQFVIGHCSKVTSTIIEDPKKDEQPNVEGQYLLPDSPGSYGSPSKQHFSFVSFDLEDKIRALPAQCLETYLQRKKNTKRKKKINSKKRPPPQVKTEGIKSTSQLHQPKTAQEAKEQMVGSQKRKARKESITRRDINSIQNDVQVLLTSSSSVNPVGSGVSRTAQTLIAVSHNATSDLLILAEVAANRTGIAQ